MSYEEDFSNTDSENECPNEGNEEAKNNEEKQVEEKQEEEQEYNSEEDEKFNDNKFIKMMKDGKYRDKHFHRFSKHHDGIEFTAFDLKEENEEGHFDKDFNYIPNKEKYDPWYESVKDEVRQKELLKHKRKKITEKSDSSSENDEDKDDDEYSKYDDEDLYYKEEKITKEEGEQINKDIKINRFKLLPLLKDKKETVKQAIQRLKNKDKNKNNKKKKDKKDNKDNSNNNNDKFNVLLNIVSKLTELSFFDVYSDTIVKISKDYGAENIILWKYKIIEDKNSKDKKENIYGEYDTYTMKEWSKQKYFESQDKNTEFQFMIIDLLNEKNPNANKWFSCDDCLYKKYFNE